MSGWMMSRGLRLEQLAELDPVVDALAGRDRQRRVLGDLASASRFSGGTGSSIHAGSNGSSSPATRIASCGAKRPCISTRISTSGPTASRTASTSATERIRSSWVSSKRPSPNGSNFNAR